MSVVFLYSDKFGDFSYGGGHPMRPLRLRLTHELMGRLGLLTGEGVKVIEAREATEREILTSHTPEYLEALKVADSGEISERLGMAYGLGYGDNPVFRGVYEWSAYSAGASVQAAELVASGDAGIAFNICGGLHHAMASRASGFCYINDPVVAIKRLLELGKRVAYVDIDAHHGDGVEVAFADTDRVLTISIHESGQTLFPGTGFTEDMGTGAGLGYAVNLPLPAYAGDDLFLQAFNGIVPQFLETFSPDVLVTQLGVDTFASDPVTHLELTTRAFEEMIRAFKNFDTPWVALGGGGYDMWNVARAWTLAWGEMSGQEVPDVTSAECETILNEAGVNGGEARIRDKEDRKKEPNKRAVALIAEEIEKLKRQNLPLIKNR
ncbi:MAG: acetoin utilization protein AcuC [Thermodesulfobacteriota bacterium]